MPTKSARPCRYPHCPSLVTGSGQFCSVHRKEDAKFRGVDRPSSAKRGYGHNWQKLRKMILAREPLCADPFCVHADIGETVLANEVDHIIPLAAGGRNIDSNLMPLCKSCHSRKTGLEQNRRGNFSESAVPVTIIAGPPGSGKTTYVKEHASHSDLIVDLDAIYAALSGLPWYEKPDVLLPFVCEARDAVIQRLSRPSYVRYAWIITGEGDRNKLLELKDKLKAVEVKVIATSPPECLRRISKDDRRKDKTALWSDLVDEWWEKWNHSQL